MTAPSSTARVAGARTVISAINGFGGEGALGVRAIDRDANVALIDAAVAAGVDHFVLVSILGASADHPIELFRMKAAAEDRLKASGLSWTIVRPTAYQELWLEIIGRPLLETGRTRVFGRGRNPINFVASGDVARMIEQATFDPGLRGATIDVAGPENLSFDQVVDVVREVTGVEGKVGPRAAGHASPHVGRPPAVQAGAGRADRGGGRHGQRAT